MLLYSKIAMNSRKIFIMKRLSQIYNMLSDKNRLRILKLLEQRPMCVCELTYVLGIRQPSVSRNIKKLKEADLIDSRSDKTWNEYFINLKGDKYSRAIIGNLSGWLNNDSIILKDLKRAAKANRENLCGYQ